MKKHSLHFWITYYFIIISVLENAFPIEKPLYIVGILLLGVLFARRGFVLKKNYALIWIPFILYRGITCIWSLNPNAFSGMLTFVTTILFLLLQTQFEYTDEEFELYKNAFIIQGVLLIVLCLTFGSYMDNRFWIKNGLYGADPNYLSAWCILPICFAIERLFDRRIKFISKIAMSGEIILLFYYILQSGSRSGLITVGAAFIMCLMYQCRHTIRTHPFEAAMLLIVLVAIVVVAFKLMPATMMSRLLNSNRNLGGRGTQWTELIGVMKEQIWIPVIGRGFGSVTYFTTGNLVAHNTFLDILFNEGLPGLSMYLYYLLRNIKLVRRIDVFLFIGSGAMMLMLFVLTALTVRSSTLWYFMIFLAGDLYKKRLT